MSEFNEVIKTFKEFGYNLTLNLSPEQKTKIQGHLLQSLYSQDIRDIVTTASIFKDLGVELTEEFKQTLNKALKLYISEIESQFTPKYPNIGNYYLVKNLEAEVIEKARKGYNIGCKSAKIAQDIANMAEAINQLEDAGITPSQEVTELMQQKFSEFVKSAPIVIPAKIGTMGSRLSGYIGIIEFRAYKSQLEFLVKNQAVKNTLKFDIESLKKWADEQKETSFKDIGRTQDMKQPTNEEEYVAQRPISKQEWLDPLKAILDQLPKKEITQEVKTNEVTAVAADRAQYIKADNEKDPADGLSLYKIEKPAELTQSNSAIRLDQTKWAEAVTDKKVIQAITNNINTAKAAITKTEATTTEALNEFAMDVIKFAQANDGVGNAGKEKWQSFCETNGLTGDLYSFENAAEFSKEYQNAGKEGNLSKELNKIPETMNEDIKAALTSKQISR
jgi:hypothetical protein